MYNLIFIKYVYDFNFCVLILVILLTFIVLIYFVFTVAQIQRMSNQIGTSQDSDQLRDKL